MATFNDRDGKKWNVRLDAPTVEEVKELHGISLADLKSDPMAKLRNDPMVLVPVMYLICQDQIQAAGMDWKAFGRAMPDDLDPLVEAIQEAIIGFFPRGQASHVREVLTEYAKVAQKQGELALAKMKAIANDPKTMEAIEAKADREIEKLIQELRNA